jgi:hypothetical protein
VLHVWNHHVGMNFQLEGCGWGGQVK